MNVEVQVASDAGGVPGRSELARWARAAGPARAAGTWECTLRVVGEAEGTALNERYRAGRGATNVLAFPFEAPPGVALPLLGDVVVCAPVAEREAREHGVDPCAHWAHLVVHGVLHLLGHDHRFEAETARMQAEESRVLTRLGFADPYDGEQGT